MLRRLFLMAGILAGVAIGSTARASDWSQAAFDAAQKAGKPILVEVDAPWCPNCAKQRPILSELAKQPEFASMVILKVDFDSQKDVLKEFNVRMQSTLIAFHGEKETGRSTGVTDPAAIKALLETSKT